MQKFSITRSTLYVRWLSLVLLFLSQAFACSSDISNETTQPDSKIVQVSVDVTAEPEQESEIDSTSLRIETIDSTLAIDSFRFGAQANKIHIDEFCGYYVIGWGEDQSFAYLTWSFDIFCGLKVRVRVQDSKTNQLRFDKYLVACDDDIQIQAKEKWHGDDWEDYVWHIADSVGRLKNCLDKIVSDYSIDTLENLNLHPFKGGSSYDYETSIGTYLDSCQNSLNNTQFFNISYYDDETYSIFSDTTKDDLERIAKGRFPKSSRPMTSKDGDSYTWEAEYMLNYVGFVQHSAMQRSVLIILFDEMSGCNGIVGKNLGQFETFGCAMD